MRFYTIQPKAIVTMLRNQQTFFCEKDKCAFQEEPFQKAYAWMRTQMIRKLGVPEKSDAYPIWLYYLWDKENNYTPDEESDFDYLITLEIPEERVLLSDFDLWHDVLNNMFCGVERNEEEYDKNREYLDSLSHEERQKKIEASWQNIFDITPFHNDFISIGNYVQGCTWCIRPEDIISIKPIQKKEQQHE